MNKKKLTVIIAVFAVVCVFAALVFSGVIHLPTGKNEEESSSGQSSSYDFDSNAYSTSVSSTADTTLPYLKTGIDNIFYTMSTDGKVTFYKYTSGTFTSVKATGTYKITVDMSDSDVTADVSYYKDGSMIAGYGLYSAADGTYALNPYAYFRLTDYYGSDSDSCLLLVDTTSDDFFNDNKMYEEPFLYYYSDGSTERLLSEANRTVGSDGTKRSDYAMVNDCVINAEGKRQLFFSGRNYAENDGTIDLMSSGGSGNNTDNILLASNVLCNYADYTTGKNVRYLSVNDDGNLVIYEYNVSSEKTTPIRAFDNTKKDDALVSGDYVYVNGQHIVCNMLDNKTVTLKLSIDGEFKADSFVCSGDIIALRGYVDNTYPTLVIAKLSDGTVTGCYTNNMFANCINMNVLNENKLMITIAGSDKYTYYIF